MVLGAWFFPLIEVLASELMLFAAIGLLVGGIDDLVVDALWIVRTVTTRSVKQDSIAASADRVVGPIAIFVPAWDEADVIGEMLGHMLRRFAGQDYRVFVGCYANDPATIAVVQPIALSNDDVETVILPQSGPTTKADCLNELWAALLARETLDRRFAAVVLHDAEDLVHPEELAVFSEMMARHDVVQLPVLPLIDSSSRWVGGHYCDEFAEAHTKDLIVRQMLGAGLPTAGVGCAIARDVLASIADSRDGKPFDADSLTEDYELGLRIAERGGSGVFVRAKALNGQLISVRAHFPGTLSASIRQKTRWITGIALMGWDRLGWHGGLAELWMRLRDRRPVVAAVVVLAAYLSLLLALILIVAGLIGVRPMPALSPELDLLLTINLGLLAWRLVMRAFFTARLYGRYEGLRAVLRAPVSNIIAMTASLRAFSGYVFGSHDAPPRWDKTRHIFPSDTTLL